MLIVRIIFRQNCHIDRYCLQHPASEDCIEYTDMNSENWFKSGVLSNIFIISGGFRAKHEKISPLFDQSVF